MIKLTAKVRPETLEGFGSSSRAVTGILWHNVVCEALGVLPSQVSIPEWVAARTIGTIPIDLFVEIPGDTQIPDDKVNALLDRLDQPVMAGIRVAPMIV